MMIASRRRGDWRHVATGYTALVYSGHARLCVCLSDPRHISTLQTYPDVTCGTGRGCPLVVHYWTDLQSVHGFRCYDNIAPNAKC